MSAYIVSNDTINSILTFAELKAKQDTSRNAYAARAFFQATVGAEQPSRTTLAGLGSAIYALNVEAVSQRYPGESVETLPGPVEVGYTYASKWSMCPSPVGAYKALSNLLYQCSEGTVPNEPLYKALEELKHHIADAIVCALPEYERLPWAA